MIRAPNCPGFPGHLNSAFRRKAAARADREAGIRKVRYGRTLQQQHKDLLARQSREVEEALNHDLELLDRVAAETRAEKQAQTERQQRAADDVRWMREEVQKQITAERDRQKRFDQLYRDEAQRMFAKQEAVSFCTPTLFLLPGMRLPLMLGRATTFAKYHFGRGSCT